MPFPALAFAGVALLIGLVVNAVLLLIVAQVYVALRVRDARAGNPDKWLGLKTAFHTVQTTAVLMALGGFSVSAVDLMQGTLATENKDDGPPRAAAKKDKEFFNEAQRAAAALVGTGALFGFTFLGLLATTNDGRYRAVRRTFVGGRLALCLLIVLSSVTALALILVQEAKGKVAEEAKLRQLEPIVGLLIVWVSAAGLHLLTFFASCRGPSEPGEAAGRPASPTAPAWGNPTRPGGTRPIELDD